MGDSESGVSTSAPLLIGSLVAEDDEDWQLFQIILLEITDLVFSPMITDRSVGVLEEAN